jgi:peptidoglycan/LPS O-acetylase OafA/YrhL
VKNIPLFESIFFRLRRTTSSNSFIPEIDGLRFLAISLVVFLHTYLFIIDKTPFVLKYSVGDYWLKLILLNGSRGVLLFFVISGFILAMPFAKHYITAGQPVSLKKFYLKRLTRLEPPYIISTLLCKAVPVWSVF